MRVSDIASRPCSPRATVTEEPPPGPKTDAGLLEACKQFEGMLIGQMMRQMRPVSARGGVLGNDPAGQVFWNQYCVALGQELSRASPLGIAQEILKSVQASAEGDGVQCRLAELV